MNIHKLQLYVGQLATHSNKYDGHIKLIGEKRQGLASILYSECTKCGQQNSVGNIRESGRP